jgi:ABC-2 type transport system permease protein
MSAIAAKDWREFVRDRRLLVASGLMVVLALLALALSWQRVASHEADRAAAEAGDRQTWLEQGEQNPHGAAHFANWAFRPLTPTALIDPGATPYAPTAIWLEAHSRNTGTGRPIEDRAATLDLGEFSLAWVLQTLAPLLVFVLAAGLVARERERGTLRLMLASGARAEAIVRAKAGSLGRIMLALVAPLAVAGAVAVFLAPTGFTADQALRLALLCGAYGLYLALFLAIGVAVSALAGRTDRALLVLAGVWLVAVPLGPRLGGTLADIIAPTPDARSFWAQMDADYKDGLPGDPDSKTRAAQLKAATLAKYRAASVDDLPVSWDGISLDASERYGYKVFDRRFAELQTAREAQRSAMRLAGLVSPLAAFQNVSAGLAGTDLAHHRHFADEAEAHRRKVVNQLNADLIANGAGKTYEGYNADRRLWEAVPAFAYAAPGVGVLAGAWLPDLAIVLAWCLGAAALLAFAGRRMTRGML